MSDHVTAEAILLRYYPKYTTLRSLTNDMIANLTINPNDVHEINIYIDLYRMLLSVYHRDAGFNNYTEVTSSIINFCAHIRSFYRQTYGVHTRIFIVYNNYADIDAELWQSKFVKDYNKDAEISMKRSTVTRSMILNNLPLIKVLCTSIHDIYFVDRPVESMITIYDLINKEQNINIPHVIFTFCPISIQIPALCNNTFIFRVNKNWTVNDSGEKHVADYYTVISRRNAMVEFVSNSRNFMVSKELMPMLERISPELLSFLITLAGVKRREKNITKILNINVAVKMLYNAIIERPDLNRYNSEIDELYNTMRLGNLIKAIDLNMLKCRIKAIDLVYNYGIYRSTPYYLDNSYLVYVDDSNSMKEINAEYFKNNPLDLERL